MDGTRRMRWAVLAATIVAVAGMLASPPAGARAAVVPYDFGTVELGTTSASATVTIPLTTTVEAVRTALLTGVAQSTPPAQLAGTISTAQWQAIQTDTINGMPGSATVSVRVDAYSVDPAGEFQLDGCTGADGTVTPTCDLSGTFTPADIGVRQALVQAQLTVTQFPVAEMQTALADALAANGFGFLSSFIGPMTDVMRPFMEPLILDSVNPVASLSGTGAPAAVVAEVPVAWAAPAAIAGGVGLVLLARRRRASVPR